MHVLFSFQEPLRFLPNFKNPCFLKNVTLPDFPPLRTIQKLRCLPYFFIVGFPKSGTTDVWFRLINHPDIAGNHEKEPNFFRKGMLGRLYLHCKWFRGIYCNFLVLSITYYDSDFSSHFFFLRFINSVFKDALVNPSLHRSLCDK